MEIDDFCAPSQFLCLPSAKYNHSCSCVGSRVGSDRDQRSQNPDRDRRSQNPDCDPFLGSGSGFAILFEKWDRDRDFALGIATIPAILEF